MGFIAAAILLFLGVLLLARKSVRAQRDRPPRGVTLRGALVDDLVKGVLFGTVTAGFKGTQHGWTRDVWETGALAGIAWFMVGVAFQALRAARGRNASQ
jgi:hypothetical protein